MQAISNFITSLPGVLTTAGLSVGSYGAAIFTSTRLKSSRVFSWCCEGATSLNSTMNCSKMFQGNETHRDIWCLSQEDNIDSWSAYENAYLIFTIAGTIFVLMTAVTANFYAMRRYGHGVPPCATRPPARTSLPVQPGGSGSTTSTTEQIRSDLQIIELRPLPPNNTGQATDSDPVLERVPTSDASKENPV